MPSIFHIKDHIIPAAHIREFARATSLSQEEELSQHVKQYTPRDNPNPQKGDVTIIGAHANGFPKELYEPLWEDLYRELKARGLRIRSIYIADAAWQGESGMLNRSKLGDDPSWHDYARDIIHMVNTLRPARPLVGIGHSFGGAAIVNASLYSPRLFASIVLLDPVISKYAANPGHLANGPAAMSVHRRDVWPSRAQAAESFRRSPFYASWDERVLKLWLEYGVRPVDPDSADDGPVTLSTTKHQEVFTYLRPSWPAYRGDPNGREVTNRDAAPDIDPIFLPDHPTGPLNLAFPFYRPEPPSTLARLPHVRPPVLYVFGLKSNLAPPELIEEKLAETGAGIGGSGGREAGRVKGVSHPDCGHLIPLEVPAFCAKEAAQWIQGDLGRWWVAEREYEEWTRKPQVDKSTISDEYKRYIGRPDKNGRKDKAKI